MNTQIDELISTGNNSVIYLGKFNTHPVIIKIEKIDIYNISHYSAILIQSYFQDEVAAKYPDRFVQMQFQQIYHDFKLKIPISIKNYKYDPKYFNSFKTIVSGFKPVLHATLEKTLDKLSKPQITFAIQNLFESLDIIHSKYFIHCDIHIRNIMCNNQKTKWYIIDYGLIQDQKKLSQQKAQSMILKDRIDLLSCFLLKKYFYELQIENINDRIATIKSDTTTYSKILVHIENYYKQNVGEQTAINSLTILLCKLLNYNLYYTTFQDVFAIHKIPESEIEILKTWEEPYADILLKKFDQYQLINSNT
jgi:hypothetical protein